MTGGAGLSRQKPAARAGVVQGVGERGRCLVEEDDRIGHGLGSGVDCHLNAMLCPRWDLTPGVHGGIPAEGGTMET